LYIKYSQEVLPRDIYEVIPKLKEIIEQVKVRHLVSDVRNTRVTATKSTKAEREAFKKFAEMLIYEKNAVIGAEPKVRMLIKIALALLGKSRSTSFFETKDEALAWLKEGGKQ